MTPVTRELRFAEAKKYLNPEQDRLFDDIVTIIDSLVEDHISDYSFLVAPAAKAYEGFLKDFFLKIRIIDRVGYKSDRFRVGKTLNPSLRYKRFSIFQKLSNLDEHGEELAETLWSAWKFGRNEIFHYFPDTLKSLSRDEALDRIAMIINAIISAGKFSDTHKNDPNLDLL